MADLQWVTLLHDEQSQGAINNHYRKWQNLGWRLEIWPFAFKRASLSDLTHNFRKFHKTYTITIVHRNRLQRPCLQTLILKCLKSYFPRSSSDDQTYHKNHNVARSRSIRPRSVPPSIPIPRPFHVRLRDRRSTIHIIILPSPRLCDDHLPRSVCRYVHPHSSHAPQGALLHSSRGLVSALFAGWEHHSSHLQRLQPHRWILGLVP